MKTIDKKHFTVRITTLVFLLFSCFYMYDFYKCLSGFIANGFREPLVMLPIILSFFLPVFSFLVFVYDFYVKALQRSVKICYSAFVIVYAIVDLILIFSNISLYASNNSLGAYNSLPSIFLHFPYDMIIILSLFIIWEAFNIFTLFRPLKITRYLDEVKHPGALKLSLIEYLVLSVFAIVIFVFTGSAVYALFSAISNALYDIKYLYLIVWVMLIPLGNLAVLTAKPELMNIEKKSKLIILLSGIIMNLIFGLLFLIFELTSPDFLIHRGKPLFLITFSMKRVSSLRNAWQQMVWPYSS